MMTILDVRGLQKTHGGRRVVDGVSFEFSEGEIVRLLGNNGQRSSFRMTCGMIEPGKGAVENTLAEVPSST